MQWIFENWFWILIGILFIGMHLFGHGGHGAHDGQKGSGGHGEAGGHRAGNGGNRDNTASTDRPRATPENMQPDQTDRHNH